MPRGLGERGNGENNGDGKNCEHAFHGNLLDIEIAWMRGAQAFEPAASSAMGTSGGIKSETRVTECIAVGSSPRNWAK